MTNKESVAPLHLAVTRKDSVAVALLCKHGANREAVNRSGKTPARVAEELEQAAIVEILAGQSAMLDQSDEELTRDARTAPIVDIDPATIKIPENGSMDPYSRYKDPAKVLKKLGRPSFEEVPQDIDMATFLSRIPQGARAPKAAPPANPGKKRMTPAQRQQKNWTRKTAGEFREERALKGPEDSARDIDQEALLDEADSQFEAEQRPKKGASPKIEVVSEKPMTPPPQPAKSKPPSPAPEKVQATQKPPPAIEKAKLAPEPVPEPPKPAPKPPPPEKPKPAAKATPPESPKAAPKAPPPEKPKPAAQAKAKSKAPPPEKPKAAPEKKRKRIPKTFKRVASSESSSNSEEDKQYDSDGDIVEHPASGGHEDSDSDELVAFPPMPQSKPEPKPEPKAKPAPAPAPPEEPPKPRKEEVVPPPGYTAAFEAFMNQYSRPPQAPIVYVMQVPQVVTPQATAQYQLPMAQPTTDLSGMLQRVGDIERALGAAAQVAPRDIGASLGLCQACAVMASNSICPLCGRHFCVNCREAHSRTFDCNPNFRLST